MKGNRNNNLLVVIYSFSSGILACLVSILIKLAFNSVNSTSVWLQAAALLFSKSLALTDKTVYATGLNKLANFVVSALAGLTLFDERFDLVQWTLGILLISLGLFLIATAKSGDEKRKVS